MANEKRKKNPEFVSPRGTFRYPALDKPDYGNADYPKPQGVYKVDLILEESAEATQAFLKKLEPLHAEAVKAGEEGFKALKVEARKRLKELTVNPLYKIEYDRDSEEPTGNIIFSIKADASGSRKDKTTWERKITIFDAQGVKLVKVPPIWGGSSGKIAFEASSYFIEGTGTAGVSLRLHAAQILELVSGGARSADAFGFGKEEGFSADSVAEEDASPFGGAGEPAGDSEEF